MSKSTGRNIALALLVLATALGSCTQERPSCLTPIIASFTIEFMHLPTDTSTIFVDTALPAAVFVALTNHGTDTTYYTVQQSVFAISLSSDSTFCQWLFKTDSTSPTFDTLRFYYQRSLQFISNGCGFAYFYTLDSVYTTHYAAFTNYAIDSTYITNSSVTNDVNTKQLQVYIHPDW